MCALNNKFFSKQNYYLKPKLAVKFITKSLNKGCLIIIKFVLSALLCVHVCMADFLVPVM